MQYWKLVERAGRKTTNDVKTVTHGIVYGIRYTVYGVWGIDADLGC